MKTSSKLFILILTSVLFIQNSQAYPQFMQRISEVAQEGHDNSRKGSCGPQIFLDVLARYKDSNYPVEEHTVITSDDHVLTLFRIQAKNGPITEGKPVVYMQHCLCGSADDYIINGEDNSIGLILANLGYDIWLGNNRGNKYSLGATKKMKNSKFWDFSFQEMGKYDVPAIIKYIVEKTNQQKIVYIGHSQGTSQMFAALSMPGTQDYVSQHISKFLALAPIVYLAN